MHGPRIEHIPDPGPLNVPAAAKIACLVVAAVGLGAFLFKAFTASGEDLKYTWAGFLLSTIFFLFLALGAAAWLSLNYITSAKWFVILKRIPEAVASFAYKGGSLLMIFAAIFGVKALYPWAAEAPEYPYAGTLKALWLSPTVHVIKVIAILAPLSAIIYFLVKASNEQDRTKSEAESKRTYKLGLIYMIAFAPLFSLFAWDVVMSLSPKWFSTMFGVYCFAGAFLSAIATMMLILLFIMKPRNKYIQERHVHDLGTYVMAFSVFMIYIGFSQFMLIWYANLYDETFYFLDRFGQWTTLSCSLALFKWVIPFFILMPPQCRTSPIAQTFVCVCVLFGQVLDLYWMIYPSLSPEIAVYPSIINILTFLGVGGLFTWSTLHYLGQHSLIPVGDPKLLSSVNGDYLHA